MSSPHPDLPPPPPPAEADLDIDAMFTALASRTIEEPGGLRARLSALPWLTRTFLAVGGLLALALTNGLMTRPTHLHAPPDWPMLITIGLAGGIACAAALLPAGRPISHAWRIGTLLALLAPSGAALWAIAHPAAPGMTPDHALSLHLGCGALTVFSATLSATLIASLDRGAPGRAFRSLAAGGAGANMAYLASTLHCPWDDPTHLLGSHVLSGLAVALVILGARGRPPRPPDAAGSD